MSQKFQVGDEVVVYRLPPPEYFEEHPMFRLTEDMERHSENKNSVRVLEYCPSTDRYLCIHPDDEGGIWFMGGGWWYPSIMFQPYSMEEEVE